MTEPSRDPIHDRTRLEALHASGLLDTGPNAVLDRLTRLAAKLLHAPLALVNLVTDQEQFSKSCFAPPHWPSDPHTALADSICRHAVQSGQPLRVNETLADARTRECRAVREHGVRAYLGVPLITSAGHALGTLCVADFTPRSWSDDDVQMLQDLTTGVMAEVELRTSIRETQEAELLTDELRQSEEQYRILAETAADAIITMDEESVILYSNPAAAEIFGYTADELRGMSLTELIPERFRGQHRAGVTRYLRTGERRIPWRGLELPGLHRSGHEVLLEVAFAERLKGGQHLFTGTMRDITERKRAERQLAVQYAVTRVLADAQSVEEVVPRVLEAVAVGLGWDMGVFWIPEEREEVLRSVDVWISEGLDGKEFERLSRDLTFAPGIGLPGRVWQRMEPAWISDVTRDTNFPRLSVAARTGVHGAFAFPIRVGTEFIGVMEFFTREVPEPDAALLAMVDALGSDIGQFIKRQRAEALLRERERMQKFMARVSNTLTATVLELDATMRTLARLAVPTLADWSSVYFRREDGRIDRVEIAHADPARRALAHELERYPLDPGGTHPALEVMRTGEPILLTDLPDSLLAGIAQDDRHLALLREMELRSGMVVPLIARGRTLGAIALMTAESGRHYGPSELELAQEFAHRGALPLDNARLYHESLEANRAKSEFLSTMSHELHTPLNAVLGYADLLRLGIASDPEAAADYAARIGSSARHLSQLIDEVLTFSRLETGQESVRIAEVEVRSLLSEVAELIEPAARGKELRFELELPPEPLRLDTDAAKLRQVLQSLLDNATKFTSEGAVGLRARVRGDTLHIEVWDTGIGIPEQHQERIYDAFWQVEQSTTRTAGGTGLGLSVTRRLIELLGGRLEVESEPGEGSTFRVILPLRAQNDAADG